MSVTEERSGVATVAASDRQSIVANREGIWIERVSQEEALRTVVLRQPLPAGLIRRYCESAARHATVDGPDDEGLFVARIVGFTGVWGHGGSARDALEDLEDALFEWVLLKVRDGDRDIPPIDSNDLNAL